jgi:hypothetical protein
MRRLIKRAAYRATVGLGGLQRRLGGRLPAYGDISRRAAGYVAYALAGEPFVREHEQPKEPAPPSAPALARVGGDHLDRYVRTPPSAQNAIDIFAGEWSSKLPDAFDVRAGGFPLFEDPRLRWALGAIGGIDGKDVLELGPLEGGHTYMLAQAGARRITAIEGNARAFLKCLVVKEVTKLRNAEFFCGDFVEFLNAPHPRYDVVLACGVLYHMREPIRFLQTLAETAPRVVLFTHYYDEARIRGNPRVTGLFTDTAAMSAGGFACTVHRQNYPEDAMASRGFSGGSALHSYWMRRPDIVAALNHFGYARVEVSHEEPEHPNGPGVALIATRS